MLGCHPGGDFGAPAAAALYGAGVAETERLLEDLLDVHLLRQPAPGRYGFHDLLAEHARAAADPAEAAAAFERLLDHYRDGEFSFAEERANLVAVSRDRGTRRARLAHRRPRGGGVARAGAPRRADGAGPRGGPGRGPAGRPARPPAEPGEPHDRATGRPAGSPRPSTSRRQRLRLVRASGDRAAEAAALARMATLHGMLGRYPDAVRLYRQALVLAGETGSHAVAAQVWGNLSNVQEVLGQLEDALTSAARARAIRSELGDGEGTILATAQLGLVLARLGRPAEALEAAEKAVRAAVETEYAFGEAWSRIDCAEVLLAAARPERAHDHASRACTILARLNHPLLLTMAANSLGSANEALDDPAAALVAYRLALTTARRIGYRAQEARALAGLGASHAALGEHAEAARHERLARDLAEEIGLPERLGLAPSP